MHLGEPAGKKTKQRIQLTLGACALIFVIAFGREILGVLSLFWTLFATIFLRFPFDGVDPNIIHSFNVIVFNCLFGFGLVFLLWLFLISAQALLPVSNLLEIYRTMWHFWLYITRRHGQAVHVRDGEANTTREDEKRRGHGVIVVDFNSAVVLEERDVSPGLTRLFFNSGLRLLHLLNLSDPPVSPRVCGPGIVFTRPGERIRGVVDLRKQFRIQPNVTCYTREGIELYAKVLANFSVGMESESDALEVTFIGEPRPDNLRVCTFSNVQGRGGKFKRLNSLKADELDEADVKEICDVAKSINLNGPLYAYGPLPKPNNIPTFNEERVFSAVFAQARDSEQEIIPWTDLPTRVAAGFYRDLLPTINYNDLYDASGTGDFPLPGYKAKLRRAMRNNGVLSYRLIYHTSRAPLVEGNVYHENALIVSNIYPLKNSKLLRDRGIKIIFSSFGDLIPVSPLIYKQRLDSWRAKWEKELDITTAGRELQAMRVRSRALADAQHDLWYQLSQIFSVQEHSEEALALRVMQALETAAADPKTRELLPATTMDMLRHVNSIFTSHYLPTSDNVLELRGGSD
jgi:hypothetical protein